MKREISFYTSIYDYSAASLIQAINDAINEELSIRVNSSGGDVKAGWGICAKISEHGNITLKVDGSADSMMAFGLMYAKCVECLNVSTFVLHRAAYPSWLNVTAEDQKYLDKMNADLKAQMILRIDAGKFKKITGYTIDEMFDAEGEKRIDITLNAQQAKAIGLVHEIITLTPAEAEAFNKKLIAAFADDKPKPNSITMTLEKLKAEHPEIFAAAVNVGVEQEHERVSSCLVFAEIDIEGVKAAIKSKKPLTATAMAEFALKATSKKEVEAIKRDAAGNIITAETEIGKTAEATKEEKDLADLKNVLAKKLNLKTV